MGWDGMEIGEDGDEKGVACGCDGSQRFGRDE